MLLALVSAIAILFALGRYRTTVTDVHTTNPLQEVQHADASTIGCLEGIGEPLETLPPSLSAEAPSPVATPEASGYTSELRTPYNVGDTDIDPLMDGGFVATPDQRVNVGTSGLDPMAMGFEARNDGRRNIGEEIPAPEG